MMYRETNLVFKLQKIIGIFSSILLSIVIAINIIENINNEERIILDLVLNIFLLTLFLAIYILSIFINHKVFRYFHVIIFFLNRILMAFVDTSGSFLPLLLTIIGTQVAVSYGFCEKRYQLKFALIIIIHSILSIIKYYYFMDISIYVALGRLLAEIFLLFIIRYLAYKDIINTRKISEEEIKLLEEVNALKYSFITNITHDFRSPVSMILGISKIGKEKHKKEMDDDYKFYSTLYTAAIGLNNSINNLLNLAKSDSVDLSANIRKFCITNLLQEICSLYRQSEKLRGVKLSFRNNVQNKLYIYSDADKVRQIIDNLLSNSIKYVEEQKGKIDVILNYTNDFYLIEVRDNGIGIKKEYLTKIFDRFFQIDSNRAGNDSGTGIGLAFCKQLTKILNGRIWAESDGNGSSFYLSLPMKIDAKK